MLKMRLKTGVLSGHGVTAMMVLKPEMLAQIGAPKSHGVVHPWLLLDLGQQPYYPSKVSMVVNNSQ